jgi:hypothetical protein
MKSSYQQLTVPIFKQSLRKPFGKVLSHFTERAKDWVISQSRQKFVRIAAALTIAVMFGDMLLPVLAHSLHVLNELIDIALEHTLEWLFHTSKRQAQFIVFYGKLILVLSLSWVALRVFYYRSCQTCAKLQNEWRMKTSKSKFIACFRTMLMIVALCSTLSMFT